MNRKKCLFVIGLLLVGFVSNAQQKRYRNVKTDSYEGIVCTEYYPSTSGKAWNPYVPTDQEIAKMEKKISYSIRILILAYRMRYALPEGDDIVKNIHKNYRAYYGYFHGGEKIISVLFYRNVPKNRILKNLPLDRNESFIQFELEYSIDHDALRNFRPLSSKE